MELALWPQILQFGPAIKHAQRRRQPTNSLARLWVTLRLQVGALGRLASLKRLHLDRDFFKAERSKPVAVNANVKRETLTR